MSIEADIATLRWPWDGNVVEVQRAADRVKAEIARLERIVSGHISWSDRRAGMVIAYDDTGQYVGCIGAHTWRWLLDSGVTEAEIARMENALRVEIRERIARDASYTEKALDRVVEDEISGYLACEQEG